MTKKNQKNLEIETNIMKGNTIHTLQE